MDNDYQKRGYLLPEGCKDLIDALKLAGTSASAASLASSGELVVAGPMSIQELATVLKKRPFEIIADLMGFGVFVTVNQRVAFDSIARLLRKYGWSARKAD